MQININSGESLTAVQGAAVTTTAPTSKVDYNDGSGPRTAMGSLNGTSSVTLLSGPTNGVRSVRSASFYNADTVSQTITLNHVQGGTSYPSTKVTLQTLETLLIDENGMRVIDANGNHKTGIASTTSLSVTTADLLTVGGIIVPPYEEITIPISLHASKVTYNLFVAREAWQVINIDYTPDIAQGGALTATVVKAVTTATPASATTPMHTANGIDLNGTAHTVQPITLSSTTADLQLATGNRIGLVLSGAMTVGSGNVTIRMKRI